MTCIDHLYSADVSIEALAIHPFNPNQSVIRRQGNCSLQDLDLAIANVNLISIKESKYYIYLERHTS